MQTRLSQIETCWPLVHRAHDERTLSASARHDLLERYCGAAWRYLHALARDEAVAEELFQEFALRLLRGDFRRAASDAGRFRDYLKTVLINLAKDHYRCRRQGPLPLPAQVAAQTTAPSFDSESDDHFLESRRDELLDRTWSALEQSNAALYRVLRAHASHPEATASEKADYLSRLSCETFSANRFRVVLHRAREKFSALLKQEAAASLGDPTEEELRNKLRQLRLLRYCDHEPRSLLDFAPMMEGFEQHNVSFVSVTQQFKTATSMGRCSLLRSRLTATPPLLPILREFGRAVSASSSRGKPSPAPRSSSKAPRCVFL